MAILNFYKILYERFARYTYSGHILHEFLYILEIAEYSRQNIVFTMDNPINRYVKYSVKIEKNEGKLKVCTNH